MLPSLSRNMSPMTPSGDGLSVAVVPCEFGEFQEIESKQGPILAKHGGCGSPASQSLRMHTAKNPANGGVHVVRDGVDPSTSGFSDP